MSIQNPDSILLDLIPTLAAGQVMSPSSVKAAGAELIDESISNEAKSSFLTAWQQRGESADEVAILARFFRDHSRNPGLDAYAPHAIDIVGTGGDKSGTFNISTTTALIVAAGGVPVIKHGNRSITSKSGSADLLEAIGIPLQTENEQLLESIEANHFCFLFAQAFHPAFKNIAPVRKALAAEGKKTVFNILGPLINPARPNYQLMGVFDNLWVSPLAEVLDQMGLKSGLVASSITEGQSMDEITCVGENTISPVGALKTSDIEELQSLIEKKQCGCLADLKGGNIDDNYKILQSVLAFQAHPTLINTLLINAGSAFRIAEKVRSFEEGFKLAEDLLKGGKVAEWVRKTSIFFATQS